jgi:hypothetical protein
MCEYEDAFNELLNELKQAYKEACGPGSVVGIAIGYGLDDPGIESQ